MAKLIPSIMQNNMKPLPIESLERIADNHNIFGEKRKVFLCLYSTEKTFGEVALHLYKSPESIRNRMTAIYQIFGLPGMGVHKREQLHKILRDEIKGGPGPVPDPIDIHLSTPEHALAFHYVNNRKLSELLKYLTEPSWRQVFPLAFNFLDENRARDFIEDIKDRIDQLLAEDEVLQKFLKWVEIRSESLKKIIPNPPSLEVIRTCFLDFDIALDINRSLAYNMDPDFTRDFTCASFIARVKKSTVKDIFSEISKIEGLKNSHALDPAIAVVFSRLVAVNSLLENIPNSQLRDSIKKLQDDLPDLSNPSFYEKNLNEWYQEKGDEWGIQLRYIIVPYWSLGENWQYKIDNTEIHDEENYQYKIDNTEIHDDVENQEITTFTDKQQELLQKYYYANNLLVDCLQNSKVSDDFRQKIKDVLILPVVQEKDRIINLSPLFPIPNNSKKATSISEQVAYLLSQSSNDNGLPKDEVMLNQVKQDLPEVLELAFKNKDSQSLFEIHKILFQIYETSLGHPLAGICFYEHSSWLMHIRSQIEKKWFELELPCLDLLQETEDPIQLCEWLKKQAEMESEKDKQLLDFLKQEANKEQFNTFVISDAILNYRFCDALTLAQIHFSEVVKAEIASNMWDEIGCGVPNKFHSRQFTKMLNYLNLEVSDTSVWKQYWQPYYGHNLYFLFGLNRRHYFKSIGSLAMPELFDPRRDQCVVNGLNRLYPGGIEHNFYSYHIETDLKHGQDWLNKVIVPTVKICPEAGKEIAIGGAMRMKAMRNYNDYLRLCFLGESCSKSQTVSLV